MVALTVRVCLLKQSRHLKEERELNGEKIYGGRSSHVTRPAVPPDLTFSPPTSQPLRLHFRAVFVPPNHTTCLPFTPLPVYHTRYLYLLVAPGNPRDDQRIHAIPSTWTAFPKVRGMCGCVGKLRARRVINVRVVIILHIDLCSFTLPFMQIV
jgi:hypothetical protein